MNRHRQMKKRKEMVGQPFGWNPHSAVFIRQWPFCHQRHFTLIVCFAVECLQLVNFYDLLIM